MEDDDEDIDFTSSTISHTFVRNKDGLTPKLIVVVRIFIESLSTHDH